MLRKLLKHEWKNTYRFGELVLLILLGVTILGVIAFQTPLWRSIGDSNALDNVNPLLSVLSTMLSVSALAIYGFATFGVTMGIFLYVVTHFYKSMYTDQGYLTHTLPVEPKDIILSKLLVGGLWQLIVSIAAIVSMGLVGISFLYAVDRENFTISVILEGAGEIISGLAKLLLDGAGLSLGAMIAVFVIWGLLTPFVTLLTVFGACSLGQLSSKSKVFLSVIYYFLIEFGIKILGDVLKFAISVLFAANDTYTKNSLGTYMNFTLYSNMILRMAVAILMGWLTYRIVTKHLNLE